MHLVDDSHEYQHPNQIQSDNNTTEERIFTIQEAIALLHSLRGPVRALLNAPGGDGNLRVPLNYAGVLQVERKQKDLSNIFWVGPSPDLVQLPGTLEHTLQEVGSTLFRLYHGILFLLTCRIRTGKCRIQKSRIHYREASIEGWCHRRTQLEWTPNEYEN